MKTRYLTSIFVFAASVWMDINNCYATDLVLVSGGYDQVTYSGYPKTGTFSIQLSKDNYEFQPAQFEINISLPPQGAYDASRAGEAVLPAGWQLIVNTSQSLVLKATIPYSGTGAVVNRQRDFVIPILASAAAVDQAWNVVVQWNDLEVPEVSAGNSINSVLNVANNPLPVTLTNFNVTKEAQTSLLSWSTTDEFNSDHFNIEHSSNAKNWNSIGVVKSKGESKVLEKYLFTHAEPVEGENLYRLKMVDQDGTFAYSRIVSVTFGEGAGAQIYPNPASDYLLIKSAEWQSVSKLKIISLNGQNVFEAAGKTLTNQIDIRKMEPGVYLLEITRVNGQKDLKKFVVVH